MRFVFVSAALFEFASASLPCSSPDYGLLTGAQSAAYFTAIAGCATNADPVACYAALSANTVSATCATCLTAQFTCQQTKCAYECNAATGSRAACDACAADSLNNCVPSAPACYSSPISWNSGFAPVLNHVSYTCSVSNAAKCTSGDRAKLYGNDDGYTFYQLEATLAQNLFSSNKPLYPVCLTHKTLTTAGYIGASNPLSEGCTDCIVQRQICAVQSGCTACARSFCSSACANCMKMNCSWKKLCGGSVGTDYPAERMRVNGECVPSPSLATTDMTQCHVTTNGADFASAVRGLCATSTGAITFA